MAIIQCPECGQDISKTSGSYDKFSKNKNVAISDFKSTFEKLDNQIPPKIETE